MNNHKTFLKKYLILSITEALKTPFIIYTCIILKLYIPINSSDKKKCVIIIHCIILDIVILSVPLSLPNGRYYTMMFYQNNRKKCIRKMIKKNRSIKIISPL